MKNIYDLKFYLYNKYQYRIHIYKTNQSYDSEILCNITDSQKDTLDISICYNDQYVFVFDEMVRRDNDAYTGKDSISGVSWNNLEKYFTDDKQIVCFYRKVLSVACNEYFYRKILLMKTDTLFECKDILYELLEFSSDDDDIPRELKNNPRYDYHRRRETIKRWNRSHYFRKLILEKYDNQCAICRCSEVKLLQACHITPVADYGHDDYFNGICLCANHHLMFDKKLIKIDFINNKVTKVNDSVKNMPWYNDFINKYNSALLKPRIIDNDKND